MEDRKYIISHQLVQAVVGYLGTRPYEEVFQIIPLMTGLPEFEGDNGAQAAMQPEIKDMLEDAKKKVAANGKPAKETAGK